MAYFNDIKEEIVCHNQEEEINSDDQADEFIMPSQSSERSLTGPVERASCVNPAFELYSVENQVIEETLIDPEDDITYNLPTQDIMHPASEDLFGTQTQVYDVDETFHGEINIVDSKIIIPETPLKEKPTDDSILKTPRLSLLNSPDKYSMSRRDQLLCATESQVADTQPTGIDHTIIIDSDDDTPQKSSQWCLTNRCLGGYSSSSTKPEKLGIFNSEWPGKDLKDVVGSVLGKDDSGSQESLSSLTFSPKAISRGKCVYEPIEEREVEVVDDSVLECVEDNDESTIQCTQNSDANSVFMDIHKDMNIESGLLKEMNDIQEIKEVVVGPGTASCAIVENFDSPVIVEDKNNVQPLELDISDTEFDHSKSKLTNESNSKEVKFCEPPITIKKSSVEEKKSVKWQEIEITDSEADNLELIPNDKTESKHVFSDNLLNRVFQKISATNSDNKDLSSSNEINFKDVKLSDPLTKDDDGSDDEKRSKDNLQEKTISPENFHTAPETTPDTEAATAEAMPSPENDISLSPSKEDSTPQILRKSYTFFLEVTGCVELCSNSNTLLKKEIVSVKDRSTGNSNCILESWSESTDKSKMGSISSGGSVYSDKVGLPFTLKPRMSLASVQTSSTSTVEDAQCNSVNKVNIMDDIQPWRNDCLMTMACDEALVKQLTLSHLSRTYSRDIKYTNKKKLIKRVSQANKILFHQHENIDEILPENSIVKQDSLSTILPLDAPKITPLEKSTPIKIKTDLQKEEKCIEETPVLAKEVKHETPTGRKRGRAASGRKKGTLRTDSCPSEVSEISDGNPPAKKVALNSRILAETVVAKKVSTRKRNIGTPRGTPQKRKCKETELNSEGSAKGAKRTPVRTTLPTISETKTVAEMETLSSGSVQRRLRSSSKSDATPPSTSSGTRTPGRKTPSTAPTSVSVHTSANKRSRTTIDSSTDSSPGLKENSRRKNLSQLISNDLEYTPGLEMDETVVNCIVPLPRQTRGKTAKSKKKILEEPDDPEVVKRLGPIPNGPIKIFSGMGFLLCYVKPKKRRPFEKTAAISNSDFSMSESEDFQLYDLHHNFMFDETRLRRQIIAGGGVIYERFSHIPPSKYSSTKLVTNRPNRSAKFLLSFIYNIPIVLHLHIIEACRNGNFSAMKLYHIGWSEATQRWVDKPKQIHKTFANKSIYLHSKSEDADADSLFVNFWTIILEKAGAIMISDPNYADIIIADTSLPREIHGSIQALGSNAPTLVSVNWAIESLLHGKLLNSTLHPSFDYDCSCTSS